MESISSDGRSVFVPGDLDSRWHVFRSKPRREKKAAEVLSSVGARCYLPLRDKSTRKGRRIFKSRVPLFAGYLFACCNPDSRLAAMRSGHIAQTLEVRNQAQLLAELRDIDTALEHGEGVALFPQLTRGRLVRVINGPLRGLSGRVSRRKDQHRLVLGMTSLQAAVAVEVDMHDVETIDEEVPMHVDSLPD